MIDRPQTSSSAAGPIAAVGVTNCEAALRAANSSIIRALRDSSGFLEIKSFMAAWHSAQCVCVCLPVFARHYHPIPSKTIPKPADVFVDARPASLVL